MPVRDPCVGAAGRGEEGERSGGERGRRRGPAEERVGDSEEERQLYKAWSSSEENGEGGELYEARSVEKENTGGVRRRKEKKGVIKIQRKWRRQERDGGGGCAGETPGFRRAEG